MERTDCEKNFEGTITDLMMHMYLVCEILKDEEIKRVQNTDVM